MNVLLPIAGRSAHFSAEEYAYPRPLIDVAGRPMIAWAIENLRTLSADTRFVFVADAQDALRFSYPQIFSLLTDGHAEVVSLKGQTGGALCSCLMAIDKINPDQPLVVANSDQIIDLHLARALARFEAADADAGVVTFESIHPRWSYVTLSDNGNVARASEKEVISKHAIAGLYYFRKARSFFDAAQSAMLHGATANGQYYISATLNEIILSGGEVATFDISADKYHSFYHPKMIENFQTSGVNRMTAVGPSRRAHLVVPAAGRGSRFAQAGFTKPKPFIDVQGRPMITRVLDNAMPVEGQAVVLLQREHIDGDAECVAALRAEGVKIVPVEQLTEGTACTILLARDHFDDDAPLLIANSDQLVDMVMQDFLDDCIDRDLDGSILVFRDAERNPKWSFAEVDSSGLVKRVAEKVPISDLATVGIYLFRRGKDFVGAALDMIVHNDRVNGEFYTCPVYNYAIRNGARIGVYEISADAMHGLGTPEDLAAYLEAQS